MQAEKAQATLYKSWYEAAESQLSQLQEEFKKLQQYIARVATFDERSKADKGVQLFYAYSFGGKIAQAWLARIKELERQLQSINAKIAEDRAESERQSVDAKEALAARDELQCNNLLSSPAWLTLLTFFYNAARIQVLENHKASLLNKIQTLEKEVDNAQKNYQHELVAHAKNIRRLKSMKKELATAKTQLADLKAKTKAEKQGYETREESWRDTQQHLLQQIEELEQRLTTLKNENESLRNNMAESMAALSNELQQQPICRWV